MEGCERRGSRADSVDAAVQFSDTTAHVVNVIFQLGDVGRIGVDLLVQRDQVLARRIFRFDVFAVVFNSCFVVNGAARDNAFIVFRDLTVRLDIQRIFYFLVSLFRFFYGDGVAFLDRVVRLRYVIRDIRCCGSQLRYVDRVGVFRTRGYARDLTGRIGVSYRNGRQIAFYCLFDAFFIIEIYGCRIRFSTVRYGVAADSHAARDGGVGVMSDDGGIFDVGFRAFIRRTENDASDHSDMRYIRCRILIAVYHIKFADFIFRTGHGIIHADQL